MKVAITHPYAWPEVRRGAERIVVETADALARRGHDVTLFTSGNDPGRRLTDGYTSVRIRRRFTAAHAHERWFAAAVIPHVAFGRFDVVHSLFPRDAAAAVRARRIGGHRVVYEELGLPFAWYWQRLPDEAVRRRLVDQVDDYGCMSLAALRVLHRDHGRSGVLIPGGVRLDDFNVAPEREPRPTILFSGALTEPRKGLGLLLEALALVAKKEPDVQLWLSGPGDPGEQVAHAPKAARDRTVLLPLGEPNEQGERYGRAWVTALPSRNDSFGMVLIESLACGTPIVVGDDGAPPELVSEGTGVIATLDDPDALACALLDGFRLAEDPATATRCRTAAEPYDWETGIAPRLEAIYGGRAGDPIDDELARRLSTFTTESAHAAPSNRDCFEFLSQLVDTDTRTLHLPAETPHADQTYDVVLADSSVASLQQLATWRQAAERLRQGGVLILDGVQHPWVRALVAFLGRDAEWVRLRSAPTWAAFERTTDTTLRGEAFNRARAGASPGWQGRLTRAKGHVPPQLVALKHRAAAVLSKRA